jgi:hypothetical protein
MERRVIPQRAGDGHRLEQGETILAHVVVVVDRAGLPARHDADKQILFGRGHPDVVAGRRSTRQPLALVAVVVRHQHIGDALDADLGQVVEHISAAEVHQHCLPVVANYVNVAGIAKTV